MPRILVIEDDRDVATVLTTPLEEAGFVASSARTAYDAVIKVLDEPFDLVLLDIVLGGPNGAVAALALRLAGFRGPVVIVTGGLLAVDPRVLGLIGVAGRLLKPVRSTELLAEVGRHLKL